MLKDIEVLYTSKDADQIHVIQDRLQRFQKSENGYELGIELLKHDAPTVKYFGALTITVFINTFGLVPDYLQPFVQILQIIQKLAQSNFSGNLFVIKKLLSCLSLIYIQNYENLDPIQTFISVVGNGGQNSNHEQAITIKDYLSSLNNFEEIKLFLTHLEILAEDFIKYTDNSSKIHNAIYDTIYIHLQSTFLYLLDQYEVLALEISLLLLDCLNSWIPYILLAETQSDVRYTDKVDPLIRYSLTPLNHPISFESETMEMYNKSISALTEFAEHLPRLLNPHRDAIFNTLLTENSFGLLLISHAFTEKEFLEEYLMEIDNLINLIVAFLNLNLVQITRNLLNEEISKVLQTAISLTNAPGRATIDENISSQFLNFWDDFANTLVDDADAIKEIYSDPASYNTYTKQANQVLMEVAVVYFKKIQHQHQHQQQQQQQQQQGPNFTSQEFSRFRTLVADLFIVFYTTLGIPLLSTLSDVVGSQPVETEAAIFLIYKIISDIQFYDDELGNGFDNDIAEGNAGTVEAGTETKEGEGSNRPRDLCRIIKTIFDKNLILMVEDNSLLDQSLATSVLNLMSVLPFFYKSHIGNPYLGPSFDFLFKLINNKANPKMSLVASRTVLRICKNTEEQLIPFLPQLELVLVEMLRNPLIDNIIRERITFSYVSIVRSLKNPQELGSKIAAILHEIIQQKPNLNEESMEDYSTSLVACLSEIGKGSSYPDEVEDYLNAQQLLETNNYWKQDAMGIRPAILETIKLFSLDIPFLAKNTIVTEKCCNILKAGFHESLPGPFSFTVDQILQYIVAKAQSFSSSVDSSSCSMLYYLHQLLISVIITHFKSLTQDQMEITITNIFTNVSEMILTDVDLVKSSLDIFITILDYKPSLLIYTGLFSNYIIPFAITAFEKHEVPVLKSTTKFWNQLVTMKKGKQADQEFVRHLLTQPSLGNDNSQISIGFNFITSLHQSFILSPRSCLEHYYQLYRILIVKYPMEFKNWLTQVLANLQVGKVKMDASEVKEFVSKLMITRGQRMANEVLKGYWLKVNKLVDYQ